MAAYATTTLARPAADRLPAAAPASVALLPLLGQLLLAHRAAFRQERPFQRAAALAVGQIACFGRHTLTQSLSALGLETVDWSAFYRLLSVPRLEYDRLAGCLVAQTLPSVPLEQPYVVAVDGVQIPRHSRKMPGTSYLHNPTSPPFRRGIQRAQRFGHLAWLVPPDAATGYSRAIPLRFDPALPAKAVPAAGCLPQTEWQTALGHLRWLRQELDRAGRGEQRILALGDGHYSNAGVWRELPERTSVLARCSRNRALFHLPTPALGRGRPRKYGPRAPRPDAWLDAGGGWRHTRVSVRGRTIPLTYRLEGPYVVERAAEQPLYLIVVRGVGGRGRRRRREPAFWLVSAVRGVDGQWQPPYPAVVLLAAAWQRWEIEVTHRELKTSFGVGEAQCWGTVSALLAVQFQTWVASLVLLSGYQAWGLTAGPVRLVGRWWQGARRWSLGRVVQGLRAEIWQVGEFSPGCTAIVADRWENTVWSRIQTAAVLASRR